MAPKVPEKQEQKPRKLEPWENKLIGREKRFKNSWSYWMKDKLGDSPLKENIPILVDKVFDYMNKNLSPEVKTVSIYGKKLDRPWGCQWDVVYGLVNSALNNKLVKDTLVKKLNNKLIDKDALHYVSGAQVVTEVFSSCLLPKDTNPGVHFEDKYLVEFFNATGIVPDEASMIGSMIEETLKIQDGNYNDKQWRSFVMPTIIQGSYQKELGKVFALLQEEALLDPSITPEKLSQRMDKAAECLGKLYEDFSLSIANTTEYLYSPIKLFDDKKKFKAPEPDTVQIGLDKKEKERYEKLTQKGLIKKADLDEMKKSILKSLKPHTVDDAVQNFYRSYSGSVGPASEREEKYTPSSIRDKNCTNHNKRAFLSATASLKELLKFNKELADEKGPNFKALQSRSTDILYALSNIMSDYTNGYNISSDDADFIFDPKNDINAIQEHFGISDEMIFAYNKAEVPKLTDPETKQNGIMSSINACFPTVESIKNTFYSGVDIAYKTGKYVVDSVKDIYNNGLVDIDSNNFELDVQNEDFEADLFGNADERFADRKFEEVKQQYEEKQQKEDDLSKERLAAYEKQAQIEAEKLKKDETLNKLPDWQKKLIGFKDRYSDSWINRMVIGAGKAFGGSIDQGIDAAFSYIGNCVNPTVKNYEVYGKKLDKAWGSLASIPGSMISNVIQSDIVKGAVKTQVKRMLGAPGMVYYTSGAEVAATCFAPTYFHGGQRPPVHFNQAYMDIFYNTTGIVPDENAIIGDMMNETLKVTDYNYTDEQWRDNIMPAIIKGSYEKQLKVVANILKEEYKNNKAMTKEMLEDRMNKASISLAQMYEDFTNTLANSTEYLAGPMRMLAEEKAPELDPEVKAAMTKEQIASFEKFKQQSITSRSAVKNIVSETLKVSRQPDTVGSLLEDFYKATSGYVGSNPGVVNYKNYKWDDPNRTDESARCMLSAVIAAKKMNSIYNSNGSFNKMFKKSAVEEQKLALDSMKESLKTCYGFDDAQLDQFLDPNLSEEQLRDELQISEDQILGYTRKEVADPNDLAREQQNYIDMATQAFDTFVTGAYKLGKTVTIGVYELGKIGGKYALNKLAQVGTSLYNKFMGYDEEEKKAILEEYETDIELDAELDELDKEYQEEKSEEIIEEKKEPEVKEEIKEEIKEEVQEEVKEEVKEEVQSAVEIDDDGDVFADPVETEEEIVEINKEEDLSDISDYAAEEELKKTLDDPSKNYSYTSYLNPFSYSYFKQSKEQLAEQIYKTQKEIQQGLLKVDPKDFRIEMAKIGILDGVSNKILSGEWTVAQGEEALKDNFLNTNAEKASKNPSFIRACDDILMDEGNMKNIAYDEEMPEKFHKYIIKQVKKDIKQKNLNEQKVNEKKEEPSIVK